MYDGLMAIEKSERAVQRVHERLLRATGALNDAGVPYAVIGGNAVMAWVEQVDEDAVRYTRDVDIAIRRSDLDRAKDAMAKAGFSYRHVAGVSMFLDGPEGKPSTAVHVVFSGEKVRPEYLAPVPDADEIEPFKGYRVLTLEALLRMKLTSFRDKDRTHIRDMIKVGLVNSTWPAKFSAELSARLQHLLDTPNG